jgi:hypothetical protein
MTTGALKPLFDWPQILAQPEDHPARRLISLCARFQQKESGLPDAGKVASFEEYADAHGLLRSFSAPLKISLEALPSSGPQQVVGHVRTAFGKARSQAEDLLAKEREKAAAEKYAAYVPQNVSYVFEQSAIHEIRGFINNIRNVVTTTDEIPDAQRKRLLKKLQSLEDAVEPRMSDLDLFWGLLPDVVMLKAFSSEKAEKALAFTIKLLAVVWAVQVVTHQLPAGVPFPIPFALPEGKDGK